MGQTYIGIDLGTSAMKLILINREKEVISKASVNYGWKPSAADYSEIDVRCWHQAMVSGLKELLTDWDPTEVRGIGVTGQMHTLVTLQKDGSPVRPAILWNDTRTKDLLPELRRKLKYVRGGEYISRTVSTGSPLADLYWIIINEPEIYSRINKFLIGPDYLVYRLTGNFTTDYCEASTSCLFCIEERKWSDEIRNLLKLKPDNYPILCGSAQTAGYVTDKEVLALGIRPDTAVLAGTGDNPATAISTGCFGHGYPVISLGTSGVLMKSLDRISFGGVGKRILFSLDGRVDHLLVQGVVQANGNTLDWYCTHFLGSGDFRKMNSLLEKFRSKKKTELLFYPHLNGEKTIYGNPDLRGAFIGLSLDTDKSEMLTAVIEGMCFAYRQLAEEMQFHFSPMDCIRVVGGGTNSKVWMQTLADILNCKLIRMDGMIGSGFGIALLALYNAGVIQNADTISDDTVQIGAEYTPDPEYVEFYNVKYQRYLRMHGAIEYVSRGQS